MSDRRLLALDLAVKLALVGLLVFGAFSGLERFEGKAMAGRALTYPLAALVVPAVWWLWFRRTRYPYALDILVVAPFLIDTAGNLRDNPDEFRTAYTDTVGDLGLSLAGSVLAALALALWARRRSSL